MADTDEQGPASEPAAAIPKPTRSVLPWLLGLALAAAVAVALYFAWPDITGRHGVPTPEPAPETPAEAPTAPEPAESTPAEPAPAPTGEAPSPSEPEIATLRARLEALEKATTAPDTSNGPADVAIAEQLTEFSARLETLERHPAGDGDAASMVRDAELGARLATMESRLAAAETAGAAMGELRGELAKVQGAAEIQAERLAAVEHEAGDDVRLIALVAAKAALSAASRDGAALAHELSDLRALLPDLAPVAAPLEEIGRFAEHGALSYEALRARYPSLARDVVRASAKPDADAGWVDQTIARLGSIVTVRRTGGALEPGGLDERLVRAERALAEANGAAALDAFDTLKGGETLEVYRTELKRRVALDEAVRVIDRHVTSLIAARIVPAPTQ